MCIKRRCDIVSFYAGDPLCAFICIIGRDHKLQMHWHFSPWVEFVFVFGLYFLNRNVVFMLAQTREFSFNLVFLLN